MTQVAIRGTEFLIDGEPTYPGRTYAGHLIQGLLFNVRAVQAVFDDANAETRTHWTYPDTGVWDPRRNTDELCAALQATAADLLFRRASSALAAVSRDTADGLLRDAEQLEEALARLSGPP